VTALFGVTLAHLALPPLEAEALRAIAPRTVENMGTLDRQTAAPIEGGLFDEAIFSGGAAGAVARIELPCAVPHPLVPGVELRAIAVVPPSLRPMTLRDGELIMSSINSDYQRVLIPVGRLRRLAAIEAPTAIVDGERASLAEAVRALVAALPALLRPDPAAALAALDAHAAAHELALDGLEGTLPPPLDRTVATLVAMGLAPPPRRALQ